MSRHGDFAYRLAGERALDAYFLGDLQELERWSALRAVIRDEIAPNATPEELDALMHPERPLHPRMLGWRSSLPAAGRRDEG